MKQNYLKSFCARFLTLLVLALMSTNLAWGADVINNSNTSSKLGSNATSSWVDAFDLTLTSGAVITVRSMGTKSTNNALQWNANGYLFMKTSGGNLKSVTIKTTADKKIGVYASNTAYSAAPSGDALATLSATSSGATYTFTDNYTFLALKGTQSSTSITEITIEYDNGTAKTQAYLRWEEAADLTCYMGGTFTRIAKLYDAETGGTEITGQTITYSTNTSNYASVDASGQVTPLKEGKATIVAALESDNYKADGITYDLTNKYKYESPSMTASNVDGERDNYKFSGTLQITLTMPEGTSALYYTLNDGNTQTYSAPFNINETTQIIAWAEDEDGLLSKNKKLTYTKVALVDVTLADENKVLSTSFASTKIILPTRQLDDYTFEGWSTTNCAVATKTKPNIINAGEYTPTESVTLYPIFSYSEGGSAEQTAESTTMTAKTSEQILETGKPIKYQMSAANEYPSPLRIYSGITITFTGALMSKIVLVDDPDDTKNPVTNLILNTGQSGELDKSDGNVTWTGSTNTVVLKASGQARTSKITVYYTAAEVFYITKQGAQNVAISSAGWATVCLPFKATITSGNATAYYVTDTEGNALKKVEANVIPAGEGILLKSKDGGKATVTFTISAEDATDATGNMMKGSLTGETFTGDNKTWYILTLGNDDKVGFYWDPETKDEGASATCPAGKAVLAVPANSGAKAFFSLDNEPTGITSYENDNDNENLKAMTVYNLNGMKVNNNYKGIVIMNGKKYINK